VREENMSNISAFLMISRVCQCLLSVASCLLLNIL